MPTSVYFNNFEASNEQSLLESLIIESIKIYGHDVYYLPRTLDNKDEVYGESDLVTFNSAHMIEMYIESFDGTGFSMDANFLSKFGLEIRNQVIFSCAQRTFADEVILEETQDLVRPREGDLIYFPLNGRCFKISYVDKWQMFYQLGALQTWKMTCELFEYSGERFNTGIDAIDAIEQFSGDMLKWALHDQDGNPLMDESNNYLLVDSYNSEIIDPLDDSDEIQQESDEFIDFSVVDPFSEGNI